MRYESTTPVQTSTTDHVIITQAARVNDGDAHVTLDILRDLDTVSLTMTEHEALMLGKALMDNARMAHRMNRGA